MVFCAQAFGQLQAHTLKAESLYNNKKFIVDNFPQKEGLQFRVTSVNRGEPAMRPIYLYPSVKCAKDKGFQALDLASYILKSYPERFESLVGAPGKGRPSGVLHVCAIENVNFDSEKLFISIFEPGDNGDCNRREVIDLIFPMSLFCKR